MSDQKNDPQSYGSQNETVDPSEDFYSNAPKQIDEDDEPTLKVTPQPSGAKRDSYFKKRDY
ncbi:MAG TPA: hypothetical protein VER58_16195 [Thermoanaerobaculia bacterium]|nr:hypothetical protein [Thermoanaerobaculia bacterium]